MVFKYRCVVVHDLQTNKTFDGLPTTPHQKLEFTLADAQALVNGKLCQGLPVRTGHEHIVDIGRVTATQIVRSHDNKQSLVMEFELDKTPQNREVWNKLIQDRKYWGVSLSHIRGDARTPKELSLCAQGARENTGIIQQFNDEAQKWETFLPTQTSTESVADEKDNSASKPGTHNPAAQSSSYRAEDTSETIEASASAAFISSMMNSGSSSSSSSSAMAASPQQQQQPSSAKTDQPVPMVDEDPQATPAAPGGAKHPGAQPPSEYTPFQKAVWKMNNTPKQMTPEDMKLVMSGMNSSLASIGTLTDRVKKQEATMTDQRAQISAGKVLRDRERVRQKKDNLNVARVISQLVRNTSTTNQMDPTVAASLEKAFNNDENVEKTTEMLNIPWVNSFVVAASKVVQMQQQQQQQQQQFQLQQAPAATQPQSKMFDTFMQMQNHLAGTASTLANSSSSADAAAAAAAASQMTVEASTGAQAGAAASATDMSFLNNGQSRPAQPTRRTQNAQRQQQLLAAKRAHMLQMSQRSSVFTNASSGRSGEWADPNSDAYKNWKV